MERDRYFFSHCLKRFPKNHNLRQKWLNSINRPNFKPSRYSCICSDHFKKDHINLTCFPRLKNNACPSIPNLSPEQQVRQPLQEVKLNLLSESHDNAVSQNGIQVLYCIVKNILKN
ncbi:THAP domain-containing protein 1 B [Bicyclus anynana]|uniref:THAP domain-containing protein 1 B n=1 Tax=Bicyclus anynana TaxID=110368 RepID=A0ABM3LKY5_BICAN|nr:THAP domain-containing protein 1 B [Bicyclus anynana]